MNKIISFIKADYESFLKGLRTDTLGYDLGDFLRDLDSFSKFCKSKFKRNKKISVRQAAYAKR